MFFRQRNGYPVTGSLFYDQFFRTDQGGTLTNIVHTGHILNKSRGCKVSGDRPQFFGGIKPYRQIPFRTEIQQTLFCLFQINGRSAFDGAAVKTVFFNTASTAS